MPRISPALLVVLGGVTAALHVGKLPTAIPVLRDALGIGLVEAGFLLSLVQLAGMLLGLAVGLAADGLGLKRTMVSGLALLSVASMLGSLATSGGELMLLRAVEGLGFLLAATPAPSIIRRLMKEEDVSAALGWWGAYMPLGTAASLLAGPAAIAIAGWQGWWVALGVLSAAMAAWLWAALPQPGIHVDNASTATAGWRSRLGRTLGARGPWLISVAFACYSAQWLSVIGFLPTLYQQMGWSASLAGAATALAALVNMAGNVAAGRLLKKGVPAHKLLYAGFVAMAAGGSVAFAAPGLPGLLGAIVFSMVGGLIPGTLFSLAVRLAPSPGTMSTTVGWMQQWSAFGQFAGPPVVAVVASAAGGFQHAGFVTGLCAVAGLAISALIARAAAERRS